MRLRERIFRSWLWRLPPESGQIALTFDDGPDPHSTPRLLAALDRSGIPSTMFVLGSACEMYPQLVRDCIAAGHAIGLHGYAHESLMMRSRQWQDSTIARTVSALERAEIPYQRLFRPPYGRFNLRTAAVLNRRGFRGVLWSQMAGDWRAQSHERIEHSLTSALRAGSIIVLHDRPATIGSVIAALPRLVDEAARRGWQFTVLSHPLPQVDSRL